MPVAPTGFLSAAVDDLRVMLADVAAFRTWVGAADAAAAKLRIYPFAQDDGSYTRPYAIIGFGEGGHGYDRFAAGTQDEFLDSGSLSIILEADIAAANQGNHADAVYEFSNNVGAIVEGMRDLSGSGTYMTFGSVRVVDILRGSRDEKDVGSEYMQAFVDVAFGMGE